MKFYLCKKCKKMVDMIKGSPCPTMCCGEPMEELTANTTDGAKEKHVPVVTVEGSTVTVAVGSVEHPMLDNHYITMIALETNLGSARRALKPGDAPAAKFALAEDEIPVAAYEYCNLHGLWKADI